ncbi:MAG TPA: hypothetical protein EYN67_03900 [Flavobacteriales bacterium]|nr:hypothetical protein [Flavobacteriales bacterium]
MNDYAILQNRHSLIRDREMENESILTVALACVAALGSNKAWDFWKDSLRLKQRQIDIERTEILVYRDDLREEIQRLRGEITGIYEDRMRLQEQLVDLKEQLAIFKARIESLEKENRRLRKTS